MAKKQKAATAEAKQAAKAEAQKETQEAATAEAQAVPWAVACDCPTPLAHNPCTVMAATEAEAKQRFCAKNGIAGTDHPVTIEPANEGK